jgi:antitoxin (DNA-binding transcriptional repressor) of toxin-antitoxin stability system
MQMNIQEAKSQLARLGELAWQGEEVVITKAGKPYLSLVQYRDSKKVRKPDLLKGQIWIAPDFDKTPKEVIDAFYNSTLFPDE